MSERVLIVDDHEAVRKVLRELFQSEGFTCDEANDGEGSIKQAEKFRPDLIVLDFSMPVMNGLQAAPLLKKLLPQSPIILYTMHANSELVRLAGAAGISAVVSKEETNVHLMSKVHALLKPTLH